MTAGTSTRVEAAFRRIEAVVPGDMLLDPPATEADLAAVESRLGRRLPEDVRALYLLHDGQHQYSFQDQRVAFGLFGEGNLLPLASVVAKWDGYARASATPGPDVGATSDPEGFIRDRYFDLGWVPLAHDGGGNFIGVDLAPGPNGTVGQVITYGRDDTDHHVIAPSVLSYLEQLVALLDAGYAEPGEGIEEDDPGWHLRGSRGWLTADLFDPYPTAAPASTGAPAATAVAGDFASRFADGVERTRAERAAGVRKPWSRGDRFIAAGVVAVLLAVVGVVVGVVVWVPSIVVGAARTDHAYATGVAVTGTPTGNVCRYVARGSKVSVTKYAAQYRYEVAGESFTVRGDLGAYQPTAVPVTETTTVRYLPGHPDDAEADDRDHRDAVAETLHAAPKVVTGDACMRRGEPA